MATRIAITVLACFVAAACTQSNGAFDLSASELETMIASPNEGTIIVDVREPELFQSGHIPGAVNLPYPAAKEQAPAELKASQKIVFVCHTGPMGDELAGILAEKGYPDVRNLKGGMDDWKGPLEQPQDP